MERILLLLAAPLVLVLPGLLPARLVTRGRWTARTLAWSIFFSVLLFPPLAFGLAMLLGTTVRPALALPLGLALGLAGLLVPRGRSDPAA